MPYLYQTENHVGLSAKNWYKNFRYRSASIKINAIGFAMKQIALLGRQIRPTVCSSVSTRPPIKSAQSLHEVYLRAPRPKVVSTQTSGLKTIIAYRWSNRYGKFNWHHVDIQCTICG